ncbi:MAG: PIN domain nuclease [Beijerinckiaceae bacterium]|nr:PIN domain nuclease [Beijerinckiaceae bacterium]
MSVITRAEILTGAGGEGGILAKAVLARLRQYSPTAEDADLAVSLGRQNRWKLPGTLQSAIALNRRLKLVIRNSKDFDPALHSFDHVPCGLGSAAP